MSYHNIRDKYGRFTKKSTTTPRKPRAKKEEPAPKKSILNFFLLDDTGSMQSKVDATIEGFNQVLADGIKASKDNNVASVDVLVKFGETGHFKVQTTAHELNRANYYPNRGGTALWWALAEAIDYINTANYGTDKIILTVFTDGENNESYHYEIIAKNLVEQHQAKGWVINFVGAGTKEQIQKASSSVGIFASNTMSYANNSAGTKVAMRSFSNSRAAYTSAVADGVDSNIGFFSNE